MHSSLKNGKLFYRHPGIVEETSGYFKMVCRGILKRAPSNDLQLSVQSDLEKLIDLKPKTRQEVAGIKFNPVSLDVYFEPLDEFYDAELERRRKQTKDEVIEKRLGKDFEIEHVLPKRHGLNEQEIEKIKAEVLRKVREQQDQFFSDEVLELRQTVSDMQKRIDSLTQERDGMLSKFGESGKFASEVTLRTCLDHFDKFVDCKSESAKTDLMRRVNKIVAKIGVDKLHSSVTMATVKNAVAEIVPDKNLNEHKYLLRDIKRFFSLLAHPTLANGLGLQNPAVAIKPGAPTLKDTNEIMSPMPFLAEEKLNEYWKALVAVLGCCGVRLTEASSLLWENIDFENEIVHVKANSYYPELKTWERPIRPFGNVWKVLKAYKKVSRHKHVVFDRIIENPTVNKDNPTWIEMRDDKPRAVNLPKALANALEDATGKVWPEPALRLRRFWVTQMRAKKLNNLESVMGAHSPKTAQDHYQNALELVKKARIGELKSE